MLAASINNADAGGFIKNKVSLEADELIIDHLRFDLSSFRRIFVIGAGKAVVPMAEAVVELLSDRINSGLVITKDGHTGADQTLQHNQIVVVLASHPIPDQRSLTASVRLVTSAQDLSPHDLVICLISGGGSSLMLRPSPGLSLKDIRETSSLLISCGASIYEMNTVRKHLDELKGGGLAKILFPASVISLILSDVIGDNLDMVASGPTVADPSTYCDARILLEKYQIWDYVPESIRVHLQEGIEGIIPETVKPGDPFLNKVQNFLVGNNTQSTLAALQAAKDLGMSAELLQTPIHGEASFIGQAITEQVKILLASYNVERPACFIAGGEATVTVRGNGKGGRNQEFALGAVKSLSTAGQLILVSLATDGGDGPTDAAGAVATNATYSLGLAKGLDPAEYLLRNDSYNYFDPLGDLIKIGPTLTNVNDVVFIFGK